MSEPNSPETKIAGRITIRKGMKLRYWRNHPLGTSSAAFERAVIVVHGMNRNADDYFSHIVSAANNAGCIANTLILAPNFITSKEDPRIDELHWSSNGWKIGHRSRNPLIRVCSFSVMDRIFQKLGRPGKFPNLKRVILMGHSAGGQYVNRYAAGSRAEDRLYMSGIRVRYIVANPSTYMYLNGRRKIGNPAGFSSVPSGQSCDGKYNNYRYGLRKRNRYMRRVAADQIRSQYASRDVVYLLGQQDTGSAALDQSCPAMFQGRNRLERGRIFYHHMRRYYSCPNHRIEEIPGVAHNSELMFNSQACLALVFGN